jgi:hypothetical protein
MIELFLKRIVNNGEYFLFIYFIFAFTVINEAFKSPLLVPNKACKEFSSETSDSFLSKYIDLSQNKWQKMYYMKMNLLFCALCVVLLE